MPELPEVETVRRGLNQVTLCQEIQGGDVLLERTIAHPSSMQEFLAGLKGTAIAHWYRRGKYLLAELVQGNGECGDAETRRCGLRREASGELFGDAHEPLAEPRSVERDAEKPQSSIFNLQSSICIPPHPPLPIPHSLPPAGYLGVHLRMSGQLLWLNASEPLQKHARVRLFFAGDQELRFVDQRTFGQMWWVPAGQLPESVITGLQRLGPEPFSDEFSVAYLRSQLQDRRRPIKSALLDQAIVAGIGNIYADEALFLSGIRPQTLCTVLSQSQIQRLHANIVQVLQASIEAKGTTFSTFRSVEGVNGNYGGLAWVYARDGKPCRSCGTVIERLKLVGRSAHFCPTCQR